MSKKHNDIHMRVPLISEEQAKELMKALEEQQKMESK